MKLKCIIIEDEPIARDIIKEHASYVEFLEVTGCAQNPLKATTLLRQNLIDLIFLDIQMPKMNGIDFLKISKNLPMVIMTTAFPQYALEGYELDVLDYLVKPVSFNRFLKACNKAKDFFELKNGTPKNDITKDYFFVKSENKYEKIFFDELLFAEAANNYILLHTDRKKFIVYLTIKSLEENLPAGQFVKVHKSYIVSVNKIDSINADEIQIGKHLIPISRAMKEDILGKVLNTKLIKRLP